MSAKNPSLYEQANAALEAGDDEFLSEALFALELDDGFYIEEVKRVIKQLFQRPEITPKQIVSIGRALHGLGRLPLSTPGLDVYIALVDGAGFSCYLILNKDQFSTEAVGYDDFGFGSDSFSTSSFSVEGGSRQCEAPCAAWITWPGYFSEMTAAELEIQDDSNEQLLDWEHGDGSIFWDWIAKHA